MNVTNKFPDYSFRVSTEGFNKEQLQAAYAWLKECAISMNLHTNNIYSCENLNYYFIIESKFRTVEWDNCSHNSFPELPEIKLNITTTTSVTSFEKVDNKVLQIEELIDKLSAQLKEAEQQLKSIKGE